MQTIPGAKTSCGAPYGPKERCGRHFSLLDRVLIEAQHMLGSLSHSIPATRPSPATTGSVFADKSNQLLSNEPLSVAERKHAAQLMRVNHCGEVCAQALYRGQALLARDSATLAMLQQAAMEEQDHLVWCQQRVHALGSHTSYLTPLFYILSCSIGVCAAACSDAISMGFIEETERQVEQHLQSHLDQLSPRDHKTRAIMQQMQQDEMEHAEHAQQHGARVLPSWMRRGMRLLGKCMTLSTRYI